MEVNLGITCVSEFPCAPGKIDELIAIFHKSLPIARKLNGCEKIYFSISDNNPNVAVTFEIWKCKKTRKNTSWSLLKMAHYLKFSFV